MITQTTKNIKFSITLILFLCMYNVSYGHTQELYRHNRVYLIKLIDTIAPKYNINPRVVTTIMYMETRGSKMPMIERTFEGERLFNKALPYANNDEYEAHMLASSHCALQIQGLTANDYQVHYSELYNPQVCIETGVFLLARHKKNCKKYNKDETLEYCMARRYNGSRKYAEKFIQLFDNIKLK